jgi:hypothetical protein
MHIGLETAPLRSYTLTVAASLGTSLRTCVMI